MLLGLFAAAERVRAEPHTLLEIQYTPVARAQVAVWIEDAAGHYRSTLALTEAVAYRGLGNRPGASQLNSGYRWPYGRREGVLPIWAQRRAAAEGAKLFPRVIYQERREGFVVKIRDDQSPDAYYCLPYNAARSLRDALDAVSCASVFMSDKGRYMTEDDTASGYAEPFEAPHDAIGAAAEGGKRTLPLESMYPPRMDITFCSNGSSCFDHEDVKRFASDARAIMPELDAITRATGRGGELQRLLFHVPSSWPAGAYELWVEAHVEGDYLDTGEDWNALRYPTPTAPMEEWDQYAQGYGYAYRGQPSVAYRVPIELGGAEPLTFSADAAVGRSSWELDDSRFGELQPLDDGERAPLAVAAGSGSDRLLRDTQGRRMVVQRRQVEAGMELPDDAASAGTPEIAADGTGHLLERTGGGTSGPVGPVQELRLALHADPLQSHHWLQLRFRAPRSERPLHGYEVRVSANPITDEQSFVMHGRPAKRAAEGGEGATALSIDVTTPAGALIDTTLGDLSADTRHYVAVRAIDELNRRGPISVASLRTPPRTFNNVSPCFIATAAYGTPLAGEIHALRRLRDRQLLSNAPGRALVRAYAAVGPVAARTISPHPELRRWVRALLQPMVALARRVP